VLRFTKLRLTGFKSFVDGTEIPVNEGLTGIVGPNGCGKSNLVEALRWVMGETSAKQMRGGEMDDVIFGGTADRPARNVAEVMLSLDNSERAASAQFNEFDELDISRRIEREHGSLYRVNGKEVRARDVQLLFADQATGARSTALVSQGRIGSIIAAKPTERRHLLEEAAGITGLHSRRHEAELRLNGAETNLERLDDILATLDVQMQNLKKQARQATRYRNISGHIRRAEATFFYLRWSAAEEERTNSAAALAQAESRVADQTGKAAKASTRQTELAAAMPPLRQAEAESAARLQRLTLAREGLEAEERRIEDARAETATRLEQIAADIAREQNLLGDAAAAADRLAAEAADIEAADQGQDDAREAAAQALGEATAEVDELDGQVSVLTEQAAGDEARRAALQRTIEELGQRKNRLTARAGEIKDQQAELESGSREGAELESAGQAVDQARAALEAAEAEAETAEGRRAAAMDAVSQAVSAEQAARAEQTRLEAEARALADVLESGADDQWPPLIDAVTVEAGLEAALGTALGEDLSAPADDAAPVRWRILPAFQSPPALPGAAKPLSGFVQAPDALARRLSQIGVVADEAEGNRLGGELSQGQRLVSRDGGLWRWDGYTVSSGAPTAAATRLEQRNRLKDIRAELHGMGARVPEAEAASRQARDASEKAETAEKAARAEARERGAAFSAARDALATLKDRASEHVSRLAALSETAANIEAGLSETEAASARAQDELAQISDLDAVRQELAGLRAELTERRARQVECQSARDNLEHAAQARGRRLQEIGGALDSWKARGAAAGAQIAQLEERRQKTGEELERLGALPGEIAQRRNALLDEVSAGEEKRKAAADRLAEAEAKLATADQTLRQAESELAQAREDRVRAQGLVEQAEQACRGLAERIAERLDAQPSQLFELAELNEDKELPELEAVERRLERLLRERDTMGAVNLRAEQEMEELTEQVDTLVTERDDLLEAIAKLRQGIGELNREGRQRLLASFKEVDQHFQALFERLFGGGTAHLALTESDDPLEAGLEIMASPPGKKMQVLSLLSGGEQALTALALLFAVFNTNPAPICVLDEVDAPLDDANVDRFCTMLSEMARSGHTRFIVITHHRMTMARMDRLFGVTMQERGVSQLVSVDLQRAEDLRATA